jgi:hypothetical protein
MTTDVAVPEASQWALIQQQATQLAQSSIIPKAYQRQPANIIAAALGGRRYGWDAVASMRNGHVIEGTWSMKPEAMLALVRSAGHSVTAETSAKGAKLHGKRADNSDEMTVEFTIQDAERAGLTKNNTWQKYPQQMCFWRATAFLCRMLFGDVTAGVYSAEELGADINPDTGDVIEADIVSEVPAGPQPLSEDRKDKIRNACTHEDVDLDRVLWRAGFEDRTLDDLEDKDVPTMLAAFKLELEAKRDWLNGNDDAVPVDAEVVE